MGNGLLEVRGHFGGVVLRCIVEGRFHLLGNWGRITRKRFVDQLVEEVGVVYGGSNGDGNTEELSASGRCGAVGIELLQSAKDAEDDFVTLDISHGEHGAALSVAIVESTRASLG